MEMQPKALVYAARRINYIRKYVYVPRHSSWYAPWLGYCLKTRPPEIGNFTTMMANQWYKSSGRATIETPKFIIRVL